MAAQATWRSQLSFSDRISTTLKISAALQTAFLNSTNTEARVEARKIENAILDRVCTKSDYDRICEETIANYQKLACTKEVIDTKCGPATTPVLDAGCQIGPYNHCIYHKSGLFSTIYKGFFQGHPVPCAIKVTKPSSEQAPHNSKREARLLRKAAHTMVVKLLEADKLPDGGFAMSFPFFPLTLEDVLASQSPLAVKSVLRQLFLGLAHIHGTEGLLHRDLKPSNILLRKSQSLINEYELCIADFGIAWHPDDLDSEPADSKITDVGTTCYRAPELLFGCHDYNEGIDLWSAGCVAAEVFMHEARASRVATFKKDWTLSDAGALGSELALVKSIFETLGTPNEESWPESKSLPDWGKMAFFDFPARSWHTILLGVDDLAVNVIASLVQYQSTERIRAPQASAFHNEWEHALNV